MEKIKHLIWGIISMLVGAFLPYIYTYAENLQTIIYLLSIAFFIVGLIIIAILQFRQRKLRVKYAVLLFVVNSKKQLLTINNKFHNRLMIPCGIIPNHLTPNQAAEIFLKKQVGLDRRLYKNKTRLPLNLKNLCPCDSQIEFVTKHEKHAKLHYAFIYFLEIENDDIMLIDDVKFLDLKQLENMPPDKGLFSDILERYKILIQDTP